ncbi:MAG: hypothetical protein PHX43_09405 [Alphaproteobacteria bacterium]|nr:hypothetical protein [Alphaproteobacteria bacterium]
MIFVNPRLTSECYGRLYDEGIYRAIISAFSGKTDGHILPQKRIIRLVSLLKEQFGEKPLSILNIGGTRADYDALKAGLQVKDYLCINPGGEEAGCGYKVEKTTIEDFNSQGRLFDVVCLFGTLNHLLWPLRSFKKIESLLSSDGVFAFDDKDPIAKMLSMRHPAGALQFDHAVYPTKYTLSHMFRDSGLSCLSYDTDNQRVFFFLAGKITAGAGKQDFFDVEQEKISLQLLKKRASKIRPKLFLQLFLSFLRRSV